MVEEGVERKLSLKAGIQRLAGQDGDALLKAGAWGPEKAIARASVLQARAQVEQSRTEIERALVRAPIEGDIFQVRVRVGESVGTQPGQASIVFGNVRTLHVRAELDEEDITRFGPGLEARVSFRGDSRGGFPLKFMRAEPLVVPLKSPVGYNTERVDTRLLQVIYEVDAAGGPIYVGQQLDVFIESGVSCPAQPAETAK